jgi:hypothetical protein
MTRNRGHFGTASRAVTDHYRTLEQAALILEGEHGKRHQPGERPDLCPKCARERRDEEFERRRDTGDP